MGEGDNPCFSYVFFTLRGEVAVPLDANSPVLYDDIILQTVQVASTY